MARTKQCARKTGGKAPQSGGKKAKGRYFDAGGDGDGTSTGTKAKKGRNVTSITNENASRRAQQEQRAIESPLGWVEDRRGAPTPAAALHSCAAPKSKTTKTREPAKKRKSGKALAIRKSVRRNKQAKKKAARLEKEKRVAEKREMGMEKRRKKEGRKDRRKEGAAGESGSQGVAVETQDGEAGNGGEGSASSKSGEDSKEESETSQQRQDVNDGRQASTQTQASNRLTATPTQALNFEVDGILNVVEPVMRDIFRTQALAQASSTSFTAAAPTRNFIADQLSTMRSIVEMYEARGEEGLTRYQAYALESARLAVGELEYMRRSDEEERGRGTG